MTTVALLVVAALVLASFVVAAGGLDRPRRVRLVERPARRTVVERRVVD